MVGGRMSPGVLGTCASLLVLVQAGPMLRFPRESEDYLNADFSNYTANEVCFSDQRVFQRGEEVPNAGPCEECRCEPPSIVCHMIKCPVNNNGCRTIQKPNHCCPDYNCECDYNGQLYNDGERIDLPDDPCQVCYCKGGDVMCTSITCYQRDDCEPKHVAGQCCPKYEDCPIRDMEASNSDDKNVQTRSPNKTVNSIPKKEIQPWLLTKSVMQTSSLVIPKVGETTTGSANPIIVSDWLYERKTTENFSINQTEDPFVIVNREDMPTASPHLPTQTTGNSERKSETIRPTPIDEVVFTRVDIPIKLQEEMINSNTTTAPNVLESFTSNNSTFFTLNDDLKIIPGNSSLNSSKLILTSVNKTDAEHNMPEIVLNKNKDSAPLTTVSSTDLLAKETSPKSSTIENLTPITTERTEINTFGETTTTFLEAMTTDSNLLQYDNIEDQHIDSTNKATTTLAGNSLSENSKEATSQFESFTIADNKDKASDDITLEHLFGLDELQEVDTTRQVTTTETIGDEEFVTLSVELKSKISRVISKTSNNEIDNLNEKVNLTNKSVINDSSVQKSVHENISQGLNPNLFRSENYSYIQELTTTQFPYLEHETQTPQSSEYNLNKVLQNSAKFINEDKDENEETTYSIPETTTETEISTLLVISEPEIINGEIKILENIVESKQKESTFESIITEISTTQSTYTDPGITKLTIVPSSNELIKTKFISLREDHNNNIQEITSESSAITLGLNDLTDATLTPQSKVMTKTTLSDSDVMKGEENQENLLQKPVSDKDKLIISFYSEENSNESKELISNLPPVLELNSHVPFLQFGGDGNSESSNEYHQTVVPSSANIDSNLNKKENLEENLDLSKEYITSSSDTTTYPTTLEIASIKNEKNEKNSIEKKINNEKVEEFTIPTIAVVPLTPGDLKMIAEYLISEKIKPVSIINGSTYTTNQWLKGNLTSEENIASILSAANVSIGLMNQTYIGRKIETNKKGNERQKLDKFEKESHFKGNSISENKNSVKSKTDYLHEKYSEIQDSYKTTIKPELMSSVKSDATHKYTDTTTTIPFHEITGKTKPNYEDQTPKLLSAQKGSTENGDALTEFYKSVTDPSSQHISLDSNKVGNIIGRNKTVLEGKATSSFNNNVKENVQEDKKKLIEVILKDNLKTNVQEIMSNFNQTIPKVSFSENKHSNSSTTIHTI